MTECSSTQMQCDMDTLTCENATESQGTSARAIATLVGFSVCIMTVFLVATLSVCFMDIRRIHKNRRKRLYAPQDDNE